jgi:hypothetical protein
MVLYGPDNRPIPSVSGLAEKSAKPSAAPTPPQNQKGNRLHKRTVAAILGVATLLGGAAVVLPRPAVIPGDPADPDNSMSATFTVTNNNIVPLWHVNASVGLGEIFGPDNKRKPPNSTPDMNPPFRSHIGLPQWQDHHLNVDDRFSIVPAQMFQGKTGYADIEIVVAYQPWFVPWPREKSFHFRTFVQSNGNLTWISVPPN